jgi:hypothetical protein
MPTNISIDEGSRLLRRREELRLDGWTERQLVREETGGRLIRVRRNWVVESSSWDELWPEGRHLLRVLATGEEMVGGVHVFSHESAAVLWALPLYRWRFDRVHVTAFRGLRASSSERILRHTDHLDEEDIVLLGGLRCTSLERTVFDLARLGALESAVSVADAALGRIAVSRRLQDAALADRWRQRMRERALCSAGRRGVKQARWVAEFADGRAESAGESVTRLQLHRLGFASPRLQVPVTGSTGRSYWVDLGLDDVDCWMEFDGESKYRDDALRSGRPLEDVLLDEKRREDDVRGVTGRRFVRMADAHIRTPDALRRRLMAFGLRSPR